jgi:hypothetical protein
MRTLKAEYEKLLGDYLVDYDQAAFLAGTWKCGGRQLDEHLQRFFIITMRSTGPDVPL